MSYCLNCGAQNSDSSTFCSACGAKLANTTVQPDYIFNDFPAEQQTGSKRGLGPAIASLVLSIINIIPHFFCIPGIVAIILASVSKAKGYKGGMATAGLVLGIVFSVIWTIFWIIIISIVIIESSTPAYYSSHYPYYL